MRKELEVVGGVKSLVHCRCQTVYSIPSHPATATIYMSIPPACWRARSTSTAAFCRAVVIYHFSVFVIPLFLHFLTPMASDSGGTEVCWVMGAGAGGRRRRWVGEGALSLPSQAERGTRSRQEGRRDSPYEALLFM